MPLPDLSSLPEPNRYIFSAFLSILDVIAGFEKKGHASDNGLIPEQDKALYLSAQECRRNLDLWNTWDNNKN